MAKKQIKEKSIEETLWESANKLRGSVEPSEYKHVVLSLIFLKYANDRFTERRNELVADGKEAFADNPVFYNAKNVFYLEPESRWDFLIENAKQNDISIKIDKALAKVEQNNPTLKGALPSNYYAGLSLDRTKLAALLDEINKAEIESFPIIIPSTEKLKDYSNKAEIVFSHIDIQKQENSKLTELQSLLLVKMGQ